MRLRGTCRTTLTRTTRQVTHATFVRLAKQAGLSSPGLISYHFKNKEELWEQTVASISAKRMANIAAAVESAQTATEELRITLEADLAYTGSQPKLFAAIVEAFYTLRNRAGQIKDLGAEQQALLIHLVDILKRGQANGEFGEFDADNLGLVIHNALTQFLGQQFRRRDFSLDRFTATLVQHDRQHPDPAVGAPPKRHAPRHLLAGGDSRGAVRHDRGDRAVVDDPRRGPHQLGCAPAS